MRSDLFATDTIEQGKSPLSMSDKRRPLAVRMRPKTIENIIGQNHLLDENKLLRRIIDSDRLQSAIFYGPSGTGKTTLARVIANTTHSTFEEINAVEANASVIRKCLEKAEQLKRISIESKYILFIDEIHRFNKAQQDILMPAVENGIIILIGATTHNPYFSINGPLVSRSHIFQLHPIDCQSLCLILKRALVDEENGYGNIPVTVDDEAIVHIAQQASGDARRALSALEVGILTTNKNESDEIHITKNDAEECVQKKMICYDKNEDYHYDTISAFIKSIRGSNPDAALYWTAKMLKAGEDPLFIARRLVILASEDIGNADPHALSVAINGLKAIDFLGMPEARITLSQMVTYLATAPKSNASYMGIEHAMKDINDNATQEVPQHLRDSHYSGAKKLNHGKGYVYPHNYKGNFVKQDYGIDDKKYYQPTTNGYEKIICQRMDKLRKDATNTNENT